MSNRGLCGRVHPPNVRLFDDGLPVKISRSCTQSSSRRKILCLYKEPPASRQDRWFYFKTPPGQSNGSCSTISCESHFITMVSIQDFSDWRFIFKARAGLLPLNGVPWKEGDKIVIGVRRLT
ncbi:hypothetical protein AVEN_100334-1 [Araneus ventricosus]|uniref:Uncharacterized protein n=1 Tax=Araneus ventricosus TaxID=182803 RepID=A0A4Y2UA74_ARAVE|nr:hypothetical protein AVEN_100334-1 [Araneus ventricosus]